MMKITRLEAADNIFKETPDTYKAITNGLFVSPEPQFIPRRLHTFNSLSVALKSSLKHTRKQESHGWCSDANEDGAR